MNLLSSILLFPLICFCSFSFPWYSNWNIFCFFACWMFFFPLCFLPIFNLLILVILCSWTLLCSLAQIHFKVIETWGIEVPGYWTQKVNVVTVNFWQLMCVAVDRFCCHLLSSLKWQGDMFSNTVVFTFLFLSWLHKLRNKYILQAVNYLKS